MSKFKLLYKIFGSWPTVLNIPSRKNNDVSKFLCKFDKVQARTSKSKLVLK